MAIIFYALAYFLWGAVFISLYGLCTDDPPPNNIVSIAVWPLIAFIFPFQMLHEYLDRKSSKVYNDKTIKDCHSDMINRNSKNLLKAKMEALALESKLNNLFSQLSHRQALADHQIEDLVARVYELEKDLNHERTRANAYKAAYLEASEKNQEVANH